jgi:hypothetical protein
MSKEIEAQILFINYDEIIEKLKKLNSKLKFDWIKFRIAIFHPCLTLDEQKEKYDLIFTRVRDEGQGTVTITTKTKKNLIQIVNLRMNMTFQQKILLRNVKIYY